MQRHEVNTEVQMFEKQHRCLKVKTVGEERQILKKAATTEASSGRQAPCKGKENRNPNSATFKRNLTLVKKKSTTD